MTPIVCGGPCTGQNKVIFVFLFSPECLPSSVGGNMFTYFVSQNVYSGNSVVYYI